MLHAPISEVVRQCVMSSKVLPTSPHSHDILWRHIGLDVVYSGKDEATSGRQSLDGLLYVLFDLLWGTRALDALDSTPPPEKTRPRPNSCFNSCRSIPVR